MSDEDRIPEHKTIRLTEDTLKRILSRKGDNQSWNEAIADLLDKVDKMEELEAEIRKLLSELNSK